jgi:thiamine biosynthesis lipoprotein
MPAIIEVADAGIKETDLDPAFSYLGEVENRFSFFKPESEVSLMNLGKIAESDYSLELKEILSLAEKTKRESRGYFNIVNTDGKINPSGIVKGWAINQAAQILLKSGLKNFYISVGGDIEVHGKNADNELWRIGIRNPFNQAENVKIVYLSNCGIATSGSYERGSHIYNPNDSSEILDEIVSLSVIGPDVCEADRFAAAAFAMGREGINFIESLTDFEGYMIDKNGQATFTSSFKKYVKND